MCFLHPISRWNWWILGQRTSSMGITNWFLGSSGASFSTGRYVLVYARTCTSSPEFVSIWRHYYIDTLQLPPFNLTLLFVAFCCLRLLLIGLSVLFFFYLDLDDEFSYWTALRKRINATKQSCAGSLNSQLYVYIHFLWKSKALQQKYMFYSCESFSGVSFCIWLSVIFFCVT